MAQRPGAGEQPPEEDRRATQLELGILQLVHRGAKQHQRGGEHQMSVKFPDETGAAHGARWDPARVLAECDAKRLLAEQLRRSVRSVGPDLSVPALQVARAFARAHRDHPDYRPEWDD